MTDNSTSLSRFAFLSLILIVHKHYFNLIWSLFCNSDEGLDEMLVYLILIYFSTYSDIIKVLETLNLHNGHVDLIIDLTTIGN